MNSSEFPEKALVLSGFIYALIALIIPTQAIRPKSGSLPLLVLGMLRKGTVLKDKFERPFDRQRPKFQKGFAST